MKGKVLFVVGLGVGYVLGTRAGRKRYEQIKAAASRVWDSPMVQRQVHTVQDYAADRIGDLGTLVTDGVKRAVTGNGRSSRANDADRSDESSSVTGSTGRGFAKAVKGSGSAAAASKSSTAESSGAKSNGSGSGSQSSSTSRPKSGRSRSTSGGSGTGGQAS
ncbi:hypothetical protein [Humibacter albus]|uniref:hypothetical protein n=1 Tax=Humibacter albus TaxID=427754 RepID=UPI0003B5CDB3|nr:hypothetical protein [Humibacter albus]